MNAKQSFKDVKMAIPGLNLGGNKEHFSIVINIQQ